MVVVWCPVSRFSDQEEGCPRGRCASCHLQVMGEVLPGFRGGQAAHVVPHHESLGDMVVARELEPVPEWGLAYEDERHGAGAVDVETHSKRGLSL